MNKRIKERLAKIAAGTFAAASIATVAAVSQIDFDNIENVAEQDAGDQIQNIVFTPIGANIKSRIGE